MSVEAGVELAEMAEHQRLNLDKLVEEELLASRLRRTIMGHL